MGNVAPNINIAVLIPCLNEALTIGQVIADVQKQMPNAVIFICDNNCTDNTSEIAQAAGAFIIHEAKKGKGNAMRRLFAAVNADIYVMVDGDGTYDISALPMLIETLIAQHLDMVIGGREGIYNDAKRAGHGFGNWFYNAVFRTIFGSGFTDIFSGYRVMSRAFVKSFPALSNGFEIETEMNVHVHQLGLAYTEIQLPYVKRVQGSHSKLHTIKDGYKIAKMFALLMKETQPFRLFSYFFLMCAVAAAVLAAPVVSTYLQTGFVPRLPTAVLATGIMLLGFLFLACGIILDSIARGRREYKRLVYVNHDQFDF